MHSHGLRFMVVVRRPGARALLFPGLATQSIQGIFKSILNGPQILDGRENALTHQKYITCIISQATTVC